MKKFIRQPQDNSQVDNILKIVYFAVLKLISDSSVWLFRIEYGWAQSDCESKSISGGYNK